MSEPFQQTDISYLTIDGWRDKKPTLLAGISTRQGGCSKPPFDTLNLGLHVPDQKETIIKNRRRLADKLGMDMENWVCGEQIHQTEIAVLTNEDKGRGVKDHQDAIAGCDGFITQDSGILCTAFFADCVPLYFFDPETGWIGMAHAGWKGTVGRMGAKMVEKLAAYGVRASSLLVTIGPCINRDAYEVDEHVMSHIPKEFKGSVIVPKHNSRGLLDLKQLNKEIILQAGVSSNNIGVTEYCTFHNEELFYSHRRDQGKSGRMLGFIGYREE